jgi:hypothetical protein
MSDAGYRTMRRQDYVAVVNRTTRVLEATDDGIVQVIKPGYRRLPDGRVVGAGPNGQPDFTWMPLATANRAMNQNKARGTVNPDDVLDCTFLIGKADVDDTSFVDDNADPNAELMDRSLLPEAQRAEILTTAVGRRSRRDRHMAAGVGGQTLALENGVVRTGVGGLVGGSKPFQDADA